jgi:hypothetical protein
MTRHRHVHSGTGYSGQYVFHTTGFTRHLLCMVTIYNLPNPHRFYATTNSYFPSRPRKPNRAQNYFHSFLNEHFLCKFCKKVQVMILHKWSRVPIRVYVYSSFCAVTAIIYFIHDWNTFFYLSRIHNLNNNENTFAY